MIRGGWGVPSFLRDFSKKSAKLDKIFFYFLMGIFRINMLQ